MVRSAPAAGRRLLREGAVSFAAGAHPGVGPPRQPGTPDPGAQAVHGTSGEVLRGSTCRHVCRYPANCCVGPPWRRDLPPARSGRHYAGGALGTTRASRCFSCSRVDR